MGFKKVVFDLEISVSPDDVGGWKHDLLPVSVAVVSALDDTRYLVFLEHQMPALIDLLSRVEVIGFNTEAFDFNVLRKYGFVSPGGSIDMLAYLMKNLTRRVSLAHLLEVNFCDWHKKEKGEDAPRLWQAGEKTRVIEYCREDVRQTKMLYLLGRERGWLYARYGGWDIKKVVVDW